MPIFAMLTKLSPEAIQDPSLVEDLGRKVSDRIRSQCPGVRWIGSYSILGPCDYLDLFDAPDSETASKVALIVRTVGHSTTETWTATPWEKFVDYTKELRETVGALH